MLSVGLSLNLLLFVFTRLILRIRADHNVSVLLIEHDMDLVFDFARSITVLVNGTVLTEGDPDQIANDPQVKAVYLGHEVPQAEAGVQHG